MSHLCPSCFEYINDDHCKACGYEEGTRRSSLLLPLGVLLRDQYVIGKRLGNPGGFGITYLGYRRTLDCKVAIKEFLPRELAGRSLDGKTVELHSEKDGPIFQAGLQQFLKEARVLAKFNHPNIVRVIDFFEENNTAYLVMEYYSGVTLVNYLESNGFCLGEQEALDILLPILDGLQEVHTQGFLHRDIKPQNIYVTSKGQPILLDFGAARQTVEALSQGFTLLVTPGYAPIEQYDRQGKQGPWTDVYGCAATLYYMLSGTVPPDAISRAPNDTFHPSADISCSENIRNALEQGLALLPQDRPQTLLQFRDCLLNEEPDWGETQRLVGETLPLPAPITISQENYQTIELGRMKLSPSRRMRLAGILIAFVFAAGIGVWQYQQLNPMNQLARRGVEFSDQAFFNAARTNNQEVVELFLSAGININHTDSSGMTALMSAVDAGQLLMAKYLIERGAAIDARDVKGRSALDIALEKGNIALLKLFMAKLKLGPDSKDATNKTLLEKAVLLGNLQSIKFLISAGANLEVQDSNGKTLLDRALAGGNAEVALLLKAAGAKRNVNSQYTLGSLTEMKLPLGETAGFDVDLLGNGVGQYVARRSDARNNVTISQEGRTLATFPNLRAASWYVAYLRSEKIPDLVYFSLVGSGFIDDIKIIGKKSDETIGLLFAPDLGALHSMGLLRGQAGIELVDGKLILYSGKNRVAVVWSRQQQVFQMQKL